MRAKIIGGGFAGTEAAYQLLKRGCEVELHEMKKLKKSPAHSLDTLCEPVCSNSFKSIGIDTASGLLKEEMRMFDSLILKAAERNAVPAGNALAVDRENFSLDVTKVLSGFENFKLVEKVCDSFSAEDFDFTIVATGPLTDEALIPELRKYFGDEFLYFYDAVAPIVTAESVDMSSAFYQSRYGKGEADYLNCPMNKQEYLEFYEALTGAETAEIKHFENNVFEGCMPIEVMAERGVDTMRFGPLRPVGLTDKRDGKRPYAVLQLRKENKDGTLLNLVGFQTHLKFPEQKRVFSLVPALKNAEFVRYGVMHRNTYIDSPRFLDRNFNLKNDGRLYFAGQLTGVEGYMESTVSGLIAAVQAYKKASGEKPMSLSNETVSGALCSHVSESYGKFVPMNANFGILPPLEIQERDKTKRKELLSRRALSSLQKTLNETEV